MVRVTITNKMMMIAFTKQTEQTKALANKQADIYILYYIILYVYNI